MFLNCDGDTSSLNITRPTLTKYVKTGLIKVDSKINGQYNYNEESIKRLLNNEYEDHLIKPVKVETDKDYDAIIDDLIKILDNEAAIMTQLGQLRLLQPTSIERLKENKKLLTCLKEGK